MPAKSIAQQHLMQAAEHGADFPMAKKLRKSMSHSQLHDFSVGSEKGKPEHVSKMSDPPPPGPTEFSKTSTPKPSMLKGSSKDVMASNTNSLKQSGKSEFDAT